MDGDAVQGLLSFRAKPDALDESGVLPLMMAGLCGDLTGIEHRVSCVYPSQRLPDDFMFVRSISFFKRRLRGV